MTSKGRANAKRIILIAAGAVLLAYIAFCVADCMRLRKAKLYTKPLITLSVTEDQTEGYSYYKGLGYTVSYSIPKYIRTDDDGMSYYEVYQSAEFTWLGITIWGWSL